MIHPRIFINLSNKEISLSYSEGNGTDLPMPFPPGNWPMKLHDFGGSSAAAPTFKIGKELNERFNSLFEDRPGLKSDTEVMLVLENDIEANYIVKIANDLMKWGFSNVRHTHPDVQIANLMLRDFPLRGIVVADSDGKDLFLSLYNPGKDDFERVTLLGFGKDNRVELAADMIWDQVKDLTAGLKKDREIEALKNAAERFLASNRAETTGSVILSDGDSYDFFLSRKKIKENDAGNEESLDDKFTEILLQHNMADRSQQVIVLRGKAIGNRFLQENLTEAFRTVEEETGSLAEAVIRSRADEKWELLSDHPKLTESVLIDPPTTPGDEDDEDDKPDPVGNATFTKVNLSAQIVKEKAGFLKKKNVLKLTVDLPDGRPLKWKSVICIQEKPLKNVEEENIVKELERGDTPPFKFSFELPLPNAPKANRLRIYFKASPDEKIGINNAYDCEPLVIDLK